MGPVQTVESEVRPTPDVLVMSLPSNPDCRDTTLFSSVFPVLGYPIRYEDVVAEDPAEVDRSPKDWGSGDADVSGPIR